MTRKSFEKLTIADDNAKQCTSVYIAQLRVFFRKLAAAQSPCHPWQVMEHESLCKEFLEMLFSAKIEKITYLSSQNSITTNSCAKTVRLDVLVKDQAGTSYDIEMCFPIDVRVYRKTRVLPFGKTSLLLEPAASMPLLNQTVRKKPFRQPFANRRSRCQERTKNTRRRTCCTPRTVFC